MYFTPGIAATAIAAGDLHTCAQLAGGRVSCWGDNSFGELGIGNTANVGSSPGQMGGNLQSADLGTGTESHTTLLHSCVLNPGHGSCDTLQL